MEKKSNRVILRMSVIDVDRLRSQLVYARRAIWSDYLGLGVQCPESYLDIGLELMATNDVFLAVLDEVDDKYTPSNQIRVSVPSSFGDKKQSPCSCDLSAGTTEGSHTNG